MFFKPTITTASLSDLDQIDLLSILSLEDPTSLFDLNPSKIKDPKEKGKMNELQKL